MFLKRYEISVLDFKTAELRKSWFDEIYDAEFYVPMTVWPKSIALSDQLSTFCN